MNGASYTGHALEFPSPGTGANENGIGGRKGYSPSAIMTGFLEAHNHRNVLDIAHLGIGRAKFTTRAKGHFISYFNIVGDCPGQ